MRLRKGEKSDKDLYIEVWNDEAQGFVQSRKISDKCSKLYNDAVFGGIKWARDESKIVFIGEKPEIATFKFYWEDEKPKPSTEAAEEEKKAEDKPSSEPKDEHW